MTRCEREKMRRQREARLAREAERPAATPTQEGRPVPILSVFECIDTSAGPDACHPWLGPVMSLNLDGPHANRTTPHLTGHYFPPGSTTRRMPHRTAIEETFGVKLEPSMLVYPVCGNYLCCNVHHLAVAINYGKFNAAVPCDEFDWTNHDVRIPNEAL